MNHLERAKAVFNMEIEELQSVASRLNDSFDKAVNLMTKALDTGHKLWLSAWVNLETLDKKL
jgi:arabinose-5-phosphate isomerase